MPGLDFEVNEKVYLLKNFKDFLQELATAKMFYTAYIQTSFNLLEREKHLRNSKSRTSSKQTNSSIHTIFDRWNTLAYWYHWHSSSLAYGHTSHSAQLITTTVQQSTIWTIRLGRSYFSWFRRLDSYNLRTRHRIRKKT